MNGYCYMNRLSPCLACFFCAAVDLLTLIQLGRFARSYTAEFAYLACVDSLNRGNCLSGWLADPQCASGMTCIAFRIPGGF